MNLKHILKSFFYKEHGGIFVVSAILLPVLIAFVGLAVDGNRVMQAGGSVQYAVDQAALAAVAVDGQEREAVAKRFLEAGLSGELRQIASVDNVRVTESFPEGGPLSVSVTADVSIDVSFASLVGVSEFSISRQGVASRAVENVEAVITMASNGTMCSHKSRIRNSGNIVEGDTLLRLRPDPRCVHFESMKEGVREFIDIVQSNDTVADIKVGLVPYNTKVRMPNVRNIPPSLSANEPAGYYEDVSDFEPLSPVVPLTSNIRRVERAIDNLRQTEQGRAWSRSDLGTHVAGLMLDPAQRRYFNGGQAPEAFDDPETQKILIMMTDGANIGCCFTNWPLGDFSGQYVYYYEPYNQTQLEICEALKENNVRIFSILFDVSEDDPGGQQINDVFARCASGAYSERNVAGVQQKCSEKQYCYNVATDEQLIDAYRQIAQTFYNPALTQ